MALDAVASEGKEGPDCGVGCCCSKWEGHQRCGAERFYLRDCELEIESFGNAARVPD